MGTVLTMAMISISSCVILMGVSPAAKSPMNPGIMKVKMSVNAIMIKIIIHNKESFSLTSPNSFFRLLLILLLQFLNPTCFISVSRIVL